jgi:hypothetical protein
MEKETRRAMEQTANHVSAFSGETSLTPTTIVVVPSNHYSAEIGASTVILNASASNYYGVDGVGARVWELIQEPRAVGHIRDRLVHEFNVEAGQCERDLVAFLQDLAAAELIEVVDEPRKERPSDESS